MVRLNLLKYHVQERNYSFTEVRSLIDNQGYMHNTLSNNSIFYSTGTVLESVQYITTSALNLCYNIGYYALEIFLIAEGSAKPAIIFNQTSSNNFDFEKSYAEYSAKINLNSNQKFTGREVTKFMNEYYNYGKLVNSKLFYEAIAEKFLSHQYVDSEVPTLGDSSIFDIAVLDIHTA